MLRRLYEVLFCPTGAELVALMEMKVMAKKKDDREDVVVKGSDGSYSAGNPGGGKVRIGGQAP